MKIVIHRGSKEIGGTCIQLSTERSSILLDLGLPLSNESKELDVSALQPDAVLISHPHQDHFGLIDALDPNVPVYIGELGKKLIDATRVLIGKQLHVNNFRHFKSWQPFSVGDFAITPYLVDHSAVDAYGFLIEAEGKRVFYSGDFRAHGRKPVLFDKIIANPPKDIDLLFMEGTMMQRSNDDFPTENDVERKIFETIRDQENISFLISSSQNIDRIVSAYRACKRAQKTLVIDIYTAWVLEQIKLVSGSVPAMDWDLVKVYASHSQNSKLSEHADFFGDFRRRVYKYRVRKEELQANPSGYLFLGKMSHFKIIDLYKGEVQVNVIYSQWLGYLSSSNDEYYGAEAMATYRKDPQVNFVYAHTSGHATVEDLQKFAGALKPKMLVPVHTESPEGFQKLFQNVMCLPAKQQLDLKEATMTIKQEKLFTRMKQDHPLVGKLLSEPWWKQIVDLSLTDPDINIQLRSDYINIYSKMGNFLRISLVNGKVCCEVHYKYLIAAKRSPYVKIFPEQGYLKANGNVCPNVEEILSSENFKVIKQNIAIYAGEEKSIQSRLVENNKETIVDVEVAFSGGSPSEDAANNATRIDLVNFDKNRRKLVFVELKQIFDQRLYSGEINKQIEKYYTFASTNMDHIVSAYKDAIQTKKTLGIIPDSSLLASAEIEALEPRPILAIAGYNQHVIDGLKDKIMKNLDASTQSLAGVYFFGLNTGLNLINSKDKNKNVFL